MKKILPAIIVGILVLSGLGAVALPDSESKTLVKTESFLITEPVIENIGEYLTVNIKEAESLLLETGKPVLPVITKVYTFPLGTTIKDVSIDYNVKEIKLTQKIEPSPQPVPLMKELAETIATETAVDEQIYADSALYPTEPYTVRKGAGLDNGENVLILNIKVTPQYSPANDVLFVPTDELKINVEYKLPNKPYFSCADTYDLLIIYPKTFEVYVEDLVEHKEAMGLSVITKSTEDIYSEYTDGRDDPEMIKLCIYDMKETYDISYVLLFGGRNGQTQKWYIPERVTHNDDGWEGGYSSDLYYGDIYKPDGNDTAFEDWDSDGDGVFAEYSNMIGKGDIMDYYPDVTVGRITVRTASDAQTVVDKIIAYETSADDSWFKKGIVVSGDTFPPSRGGSPGWNEGEMETGVTADLLEGIGFTMEKLWLSEDLWDTKTIIDTLSAGAGVMHIAGHGNPASWGNFPPDAETEEEYINGLKLADMRKIKNDDMLPVTVVGGCHNAQFNVTMSNIITGILQYGLKGYFFGQPYRFYYMEWVPRDFCSWLLLEEGGGSIGSMGMTGLGYGYVNEHATAGLGGWIEPRFFDAYANQSIDIMGEAHDQAITDYINIIGGVNSDQIDRKTIEEWTLIGDPSLKLGGYD